MRQLFVLGLAVLSVGLLLWDNAYGAGEWSIFAKGFLCGAVVISIVLGMGRRAAATRS